MVSSLYQTHSSTADFLKPKYRSASLRWWFHTCPEYREELEDVSPSVSPLGLETLWKFHAKVILDGRLGVRLDEVYLPGVTIVDGGHR